MGEGGSVSGVVRRLASLVTGFAAGALDAFPDVAGGLLDRAADVGSDFLGLVGGGLEVDVLHRLLQLAAGRIGGLSGLLARVLALGFGAGAGRQGEGGRGGGHQDAHGGSPFGFPNGAAWRPVPSTAGRVGLKAPPCASPSLELPTSRPAPSKRCWTPATRSPASIRSRRPRAAAARRCGPRRCTPSPSPAG